MAQYELNIRDYWRVITRHKLLIILSTIFLALSSFVFTEFRRPAPLYQATSAVKFEEVTAFSKLFFDYVTRSPYNTLSTQAMAITSFPVMARVARKMEWIEADTTDSAIQGDAHLMEMVFGISGMVEAMPLNDTNIIDISVISSSALEAQQLANFVAEAYHEENIFENKRQAMETRKFIESQLEITEKKLKEAEESLLDFREEKDLLSIDTQVDNDLHKIAALESDLDRILVEKAETQALLEKLHNDEREKEGSHIFSRDPTSALFHLGQVLSDLELKRKHLLLDFTPSHPQVMDIDAQISNVREEMEKNLLGKIETLESRRESLKGQIAEIRKANETVPEQALDLARLQREVSVNEEMYSLLKSKYQEALIEESGTVSEVTVVRLASLPGFPINEINMNQKIILGALIGLVLGLLFAFVLETFDTSIGTIEDIESYLNVPVLGVVPFVQIEEIKERFLKKPQTKSPDHYDEDIMVRMITHFAPRSTAAEAYRTLRTHLLSIHNSGNKKVFLCTSCSAYEGKSSTSANLVITLAQTGVKTLLVEADMRRPNLFRIFGIDQEPGLSDFLVGAADWDEVVNDVIDLLVGAIEFEDIVMTPGMDNLHIIPSGKIPLNPSELLSSPRIGEFVAMARERYDIVLFDTPPILLVTDATALASRMDGILMVYQVGKVPRGALKRAKLSLESVQASVDGIVLNGIRGEMHHDVDLFKYTSQYYMDSEVPDNERRRWEQHVSLGKKLWEKSTDIFRKTS